MRALAELTGIARSMVGPIPVKRPGARRKSTKEQEEQEETGQSVYREGPADGIGW